MHFPLPKLWNCILPQWSTASQLKGNIWCDGKKQRLNQMIAIVDLQLCNNDSTININNLLCLYSAFLGTQSALHRRGGDLLNHHQCAASTWMMRRQPYCARTPTTHQLTGGEETVMKPIGVWGWLGGHDGQRPMGKFGQNAGVTPLLFFEGHPGIFNDHRESGPRFNGSSEGPFHSYSF